MPLTGSIPCPRCKATSGHTGHRLMVESLELDLGYNGRWEATGETLPRQWINCGDCGYSWNTVRDLGGYG